MVSSPNILSGVQQRQLIAIQSTQRAVDVVTERLATGLSVNSALDNPQNFFTARSLSFRASDLNRLLDGIGQSIRTIEIAQNGIETQLGLIDQAEALLSELEKSVLAGEFDPDGIPDNVTQIRPRNPSDFELYVPGQDFGGTFTITNGGEQFRIEGNVFRQLSQAVEITADTVLEFEFRGTLPPEIAAIGFETDNDFGNDPNRFFLFGTQRSGISYAAPITQFEYSGSGDFERVEIPVGQFFTGNFTAITFINDDDNGPLGNSEYRNVILREGPALDTGANIPESFTEDYLNLLDQIDLLSLDANFRGINLLGDETLTTFFNEELSSSLTTEGIDATAEGLGITRTRLNTLDDVRESLETVRSARETLRNFSTTLTADFGIIQTREDFTRTTINTLRAGGDDLTVADQNQNGAEFLALQVRQQLQFSTLASPQASILELF